MVYGVLCTEYNYIHYEENDYRDHLQVYELFQSAKKKKKKKDEIKHLRMQGNSRGKQHDQVCSIC